MGCKYLIVGAGVSGLAMADQLSQNGQEVVIVEKQETPGGLAQTFTYGEFKFDSGPHWIFLDNYIVKEYVLGLLGDVIYEKQLNPGVYFLGKYYKWPLTIDVITKLPFHVMLSAFFDMVKLVLSKPAKPSHYEELMLAKFGRTLYNLDFEPYTRKFTKTKLTQLHIDWSKIGVNRSLEEKPEMDSIFSIVAKTLMPKKPKIGYYLDEGVVGLPKAQLRRIEGNGGRLLTGNSVKRIDLEGDRICSVTFVVAS